MDLRTKLEIQQRRILDFADAAEILDFSEGKTIPLILQKDHLVLVTVFKQIETKLDALANFTKRYEELQHEAEANDDDDVSISDLDVKEQYQTLKKWDQRLKLKSHMKGTNHIVKYYQIGKDIVKHPKRLRWTAFDEKEFVDLVKDLSGYNDFLHGLLQGEYSRRLEERTKRTYLEMVLVRDEIRDLKQLFINTIILTQHGHGGATSSKSDDASDVFLDMLAGTKCRSVLNDASDDEKPPEYHELIQVVKLDYKLVIIADGEQPVSDTVVLARKRTPGQLMSTTDSSSAVQIFIEWKVYDPSESSPSIPEAANTERVKGLVSLLQSTKPNEFAIPECLGFFDLRDDTSNAALPPLFGLVYMAPSSEPDVQIPISLLSQLESSKDMPSLTERMKLAYRVSDSILYFNSVRWYHKTLRSDAVIFHQDPKTKQIDFSRPFLSAFEYARPSSYTGNSTHVPENPLHEMYVHPDYQTAKYANYARSFDIYSLGIILLEIAYWEPIQIILKNELEDPEYGPRPKEARNVQSILLSAEKSYLSKLRSIAGVRFFNAVHGCIKGLVGNGEDEDDIKVSMNLHEAFLRNVVENLGALLDL